MNDPIAVSLQRPVEAVRIPSGEVISLPEGISVVISQALGGSFTIYLPAEGGMCRINGQDADALGLPVPTLDLSKASGRSLEEQIWEQLRDCYDPEIHVNIVDLGLIYNLHVEHAEGGALVFVKMTLTAPGCGMGPVLAADARRRIASLSGVKEAVVDVVWDPPWGPERISPEGRRQLGMDEFLTV